MQHPVEIFSVITLPPYESVQFRMFSRPIPFYIPRVLPIIKSCSHPYFFDFKAISNQTNPFCTFSTRRIPPRWHSIDNLPMDGFIKADNNASV